jgi:hypothetical protein
MLKMIYIYIYNAEEENPSQIRVTWRINNPRYGIGIKKEYQKDELVKNKSSIKKNV